MKKILLRLRYLFNQSHYEAVSDARENETLACYGIAERHRMVYEARGETEKAYAAKMIRNSMHARSAWL